VGISLSFLNQLTPYSTILKRNKIILHHSSRRGELARAKVAVLPRCSTPVKPEIRPNRKPCISISSWT